MINQATGTEDVEPQVLVGVRPALAVPLLADDSRITVGVENEPIVRRWEDVS